MRNDSAGKSDARRHYFNEFPSATLTCEVHQVFPLPLMTIHRINSDGRFEVLQNAHNKVDRFANGTYNLKVSATVNDDELVESFGYRPISYECVMHLPDEIPVEMNRKRITYLPRMYRQPLWRIILTKTRKVF